MKPIAAKYQISAMPTFLVLKNGESLDTMKGADPRGLKAIVEKHAVPPSLPAQAEQAKAEGNKAFTSGDYLKAIELYGQAITHAPRSAVLHANRAFSYIKLIQGTNTPIEERKTLRPKALQDAILATELDERWGKGWVRLAEAMLLAGDDEAMQDVAESARDVQKQKCLEGAIEALQNAVGLSDGKVKMGMLLPCLKPDPVLIIIAQKRKRSWLN